MKLLTSLTLSLAAMVMLAMPVTAAVVPDMPAVQELKILGPAAMLCKTSLGIEATLVFVEALDGCNPALAEATGTCFQLLPDATRVNAATLPPAATMRCTAFHPLAPPG